MSQIFWTFELQGDCGYEVPAFSLFTSLQPIKKSKIQGMKYEYQNYVIKPR